MRASRSDTRAASQAFERTRTHEIIWKKLRVYAVRNQVIFDCYIPHVLQALPKILNVAILLGAHTLLFGVLGFALFSGVQGRGKCAVDRSTGLRCSTFADICRDYFSSLQDSFMQRMFMVLPLIYTVQHVVCVRIHACMCVCMYVCMYV